MFLAFIYVSDVYMSASFDQRQGENETRLLAKSDFTIYIIFLFHNSH